jgi:bifunctional DNA primase/polymerase-like protein
MTARPALPTALAWARRGHGVFPLWWPVAHSGQCACGRLCGKAAAKHPHGRYAPNGHLSATTDADIIKELFDLRVPEANLGVSTEKLVVIDVDPRHGGDDSLELLDLNHEFPPTWRALTGGGGEHIIFAAPDGVEIASFRADGMANPPLGVGVDVRARGGYIVSVPSRHISGRSYAWSVDHHPADTPLAPAPDWLIEKLTRHNSSGGKAHDSDEWTARKAGMISEYRDYAVAQIAGKLLRAVSLDPAFVATLVHDWNACHCDPPLPEHEVQAIFNRICKKHRQRVEAGNAW